MKKSTSSKAGKERYWYDDLDAYPKDQTQKTPLKERFCVVMRATIPGLHEKVWVWRDPYWVTCEYCYIFDKLLVMPSDTKKFMLMSGCGLVGSSWKTKAWLKSNGYVELFQGIYPHEWRLKKDTMEFFTGMAAGPQLGKMIDEASYPICPLLGKRVWSSDWSKYYNADGELFNASSLGLKKDKHYRQCHCCKMFSHIAVMHDHPEYPVSDHVGVCPKCYNALIEKTVIRGYDDSNFLPPIPDQTPVRRAGKIKTVAERRLFGVEVELGFQTGDRVKNAINVWETVGKDFCYIKHDGSITKKQFDNGYIVKNVMKYGFEVVSAPAGINVHRHRWKALEQCKAFSTFRAWDADSCGFHVHVARNALTPLQIGRILVFMNHTNNRYFIEVVAGRAANFYTKFIDKKLTDLSNQDNDKYLALRTNKEATIEFRIFRGTVNYRHIIRNIEFCDAVCDFCAPCVTSVTELGDFRNFIRFVKERKGYWPLLQEWLGSMQLIAKKPMPMNDTHFKAIPIQEAVDERVADQLKGLMMVMGGKGPIEEILGKCPKPPEASPKKKKAVDTESDPE